MEGPLIPCGIDAQTFWFDLQAAVYGVVIEKFEGEWLIFPACPDPLGVQETLPLLESYLSQ